MLGVPSEAAGLRAKRDDTSRETANGTEKDKNQLRGIGRTAAMSTADKDAAGRGAISCGGARKWVLAALAVLSSGVEQSVVVADKRVPGLLPRVESYEAQLAGAIEHVLGRYDESGGTDSTTLEPQRRG